MNLFNFLFRGAEAERKGNELVQFPFPRREQYMWPSGQIAQKPRAMQTRLQIAEAYFTLSAKTEESGRNSHCVTRPYSAARQMDSILDLHRARFGWFFAAGGNYMGRSQIYIVR